MRMNNSKIFFFFLVIEQFKDLIEDLKVYLFFQYIVVRNMFCYLSLWHRKLITKNCQHILTLCKQLIDYECKLPLGSCFATP